MADPVIVDEEAGKPSAAKPKKQPAAAPAEETVNVAPSEETVAVALEEKVAVAASVLPASVTLEYPYAYYADDGRLIAWAPGTVVTDAADIADLIARKAPLKG